MVTLLTTYLLYFFDKNNAMTSIRLLVQEILEKGYLLSFATLDERGVWAADVIYVHDDSFTLYLLGIPRCLRRLGF